MHSEINVYFRSNGSRKVLPIEGADGENSAHQIGNYIRTKTRDNPNQGRIYDNTGIDLTLNQMNGGSREPCVGIKIIGKINTSQDGLVHDVSGISQCQSAGHGNCAKIALPVLTPERENKRQNGRRFKDDGEPMFTLTAQDRHGVAVAIDDAYGCEGIRIYENYVPALRSETHGDVPELCVDMSGKIPKQKDGVYVEMPEGFLTYAIWYEKYQCYIAIRKLTPKECFRLQGWTDDYFEKAAFVSSDSQLYKQAGNGVTVSVVQSIAEKLN